MTTCAAAAVERQIKIFWTLRAFAQSRTIQSDNGVGAEMSYRTNKSHTWNVLTTSATFEEPTKRLEMNADKS